MKRTIIIAAGIFTMAFGVVSCDRAGGNDPGSAYMPDMYYARAYETYGYNNVEGEYDSLKKRGIKYTGLPVPGTIARGEYLPYGIGPADSVAAKSLVNPLDTMATTQGLMKEAERLYLVNCGICHGTKLDGAGPLLNSGAYVAVPADLTSPNIKAQSDGHYFYVITHGIRAMGSYGSQLTTEQRWMVIRYLRMKQQGKASAAGADTTATTASATTADTTSTN